MPSKITALRLTDDEIALLDAQVAHLRATQGGRVSRSEVIRRLIRRNKPPEGSSPTAFAWRAAYTQIFGKES